MANYHYDESGVMAAYFVVSVLFIILVPSTFSLFSSFKAKSQVLGCQCRPCVDQRARIRRWEKGSLLRPKISKLAIFVTVGWALFAFLATRVSSQAFDSKLYDPYEILGIKQGITEKEIKSRYKKLSLKFHPDKVKLAINQTVEEVAAKFVEITKAYKSLTDETIRGNYEKYGHPDGRQEMSMGIAIPIQFIEGKNNVWVLGLYALIFGFSLPALVGRWWFGNQKKTKDGVNAKTAASFFLSVKEEWGIDELVGVLGKGFAKELQLSSGSVNELKELELKVREGLGENWRILADAAGVRESKSAKRAFILVSAHLLRIPVTNKSLREEQMKILLQSPQVLTSLLNICLSRNWLTPSLAAVQLSAHLTQAVPPPPKTVKESDKDWLKFSQLPDISLGEVDKFKDVHGFDGLVENLKSSNDPRAGDVKKAIQNWGSVQIVGSTFKVVGERIVTPLSFINLIVKLRIPRSPVAEEELSIQPRDAEKREQEFLVSKKDVEDVLLDNTGRTWAHAPHWPQTKKPSWWIVLGDIKANRVVVPPFRVSDIPFTDSDYRMYKTQFQAPPNVGSYTWRVFVVSDTYVGDDTYQDITLDIEDASTLGEDAQGAEDEISDPEEDSLAGQMAMMRGGSVKKRQVESDDDDSDTDGDEKGDDSSDSDSD
ncbi:DnaJ-domain-containing protein [Thelephora ganbajun]|uniref:DnaJ-domain-containing protein n=1 Tax=Thelephora ganbajun TaxID=370292 RepID=A0ACB6ZJL7_THEGA|nr:DnaJ-domain-containing protein [Thelephora ganbajun]